MKRKVLMSIVTAMSVLLLSLGNSLTSVKANASDETQGELSSVQEELLAVYQGFINIRSLSGLEEARNLLASDDVVDAQKERIIGQERMAFRIGAVFDTVEEYVQIGDVEIDSFGQARTEFYVMTLIDYHYPGIEGTMDFALYGVPHQVEFIKVGQSWVIQEDLFNEIELTGVSSKKLPDCPEEETSGSFSKELSGNLLKEHACSLRNDPNNPFDFNADDAIHYAVQYCGFPSGTRAGNRNGINSGIYAYSVTYYNPLYIINNNGQNDCANFVSQCLQEGGMIPDTVWYYNQWNTYWVGAQELGTYLSNTYMAEEFVLADYSNVYPGNPVFWRAESWTWNNNYYSNTNKHQMFCIGYNSGGVPIICCHSPNTYRMPITAYDYRASGSYRLRTVRLFNANYHTAHLWNGPYYNYNATYHYQLCECCESRNYTLHTPNESGVCTQCGSTGPFILP